MSRPNHDPPPSYAEAPPSYQSILTPIPLSSPIPISSPSSPGPTSQPTTPLTALLNPLSTHLHLLPLRIREATAASQTRQTDVDLELLSHIIPHVESFLSSHAAAAARTGFAQLVVVPEGVVGSRWELSEGEERGRAGDVVRVARVGVDGFPEAGWGEGGEGQGGEEKKGKGGRKSGGFDDDWGRWEEDGGGEGRSGDKAAEAFWFGDESMARRLAAYLQPKETVRTERKDIRAEVRRKQKEKKGGLFGWGKKAPVDKGQAEVSVGDDGPVGPVVRDTEGVTMTVRGKEVTFRRENDFGIWESLSGFGIVVTIRVRKI